jgi:PhzF family phenazine biosynthesis protein
MTVDVFTHTALLGNPVAVVLGADGLSDAQMQAFARWTNLSETTFVLQPSPKAGRRGRLPAAHLHACGRAGFAGHPTLGSCHAWLAQGGQPRNPEQVLQECKGLVPLAAMQGALFSSTLLDSQEISEEELAPVLQALGLQREQLLMARSLATARPGWACCSITRTRCWAWSPILRRSKAGCQGRSGGDL